MIEVNGLRKYFGQIKAVDGISFGVKKGEIFGFLGPNGAGKTTTISILSGLLKPDSGTVTIGGLELSGGDGRVRSMMGIVPQEIALYEDLSGRENLHYWGSLYGLSGPKLKEEAERVLGMVDLLDRADDPVGKYSGGMKRRINLCAGLIHRPKLILLDEPTLGIDPQARIRILDIVKKEAEQGTTVIYTTHYLEEAESLCHRIAIIDQGRIHAMGTLAELIKLVGEEDLVTVTGDFGVDSFPPIPAGTRIDMIADGTVRLVVEDRGNIGRVLSGLFSSGLHVETVAIREPDLQGVFLKLTGKELRD